jgi:hypothetical protein
VTTTTWVPVFLALIPAVAGVVAVIVQRQAALPRPIRRLGHAVDFLSKSPEDSDARKALDQLVVAAANATRAQIEAASAKKLNPYSLIWLIVFALVGGVSIYWLAQWIIATEQSGPIALAWVVTVFVGIIFTILVALWVTLLYKPQEEKGDAKNSRK